MGMGPIRIIATACLLAMLAACAAPPAQLAGDDKAGAAAPRADAGAAEQTTPRPRVGERIELPPVSTPYPPSRTGEGGTVRVDRSCRGDADCVVKDVGNCCGAMPACVNRASPTDPAGVRAQCAKEGATSVCGFTEIEGCRCLDGQCVAGVAPIDPSVDPPVPAR